MTFRGFYCVYFCIYIYIYIYISMKALRKVNTSSKLFCLYLQAHQRICSDSVYSKVGNRFCFFFILICICLYAVIFLQSLEKIQLFINQMKSWTFSYKTNPVNIYNNTPKSSKWRAICLNICKNPVAQRFKNNNGSHSTRPTEILMEDLHR